MIDIIIINYNCTNHLQVLLESLASGEEKTFSRRARYTVTVVDNHSSDGSVYLVKNLFPWVNLITRETNGGYAAAVNDGIAATSNGEILLLNSDIRITPSAAAGLARIWERLNFPGIVAPLHLEPDDFPQLTWGSFPIPQAEAKRKKLERALAQRKSWAKNAVLTECCKTREVDWVSGSCMFFSRTMAQNTGIWDQNFFLYFEDIDWCLRAKQKGYLVFHTAEVQVIHQHGASMKTNPGYTELEYRRSQCYFIKKYFGAGRLFQVRLYLTVKLLARWIIGSCSGFDRNMNWHIIKEIWQRIE